MTEFNNSLLVPVYDEIKDYSELKYPYSDKYMVYDKTKHQYKLTPEALTKFGVDTSDLDDDKKIAEFINTVTRSVYSYIKVKAGTRNYPFMCYRIAKGFGNQTLSHFDFRTLFFEEVLLVQARYLAENGYAKDMPKTVVSESGRVKASDLSENDGYWLHDDVITTLDMLNLTSSQRIRETLKLNWSEY